MHVYTVVRVKADSAKEAIKKVNELLSEVGEYHSSEHKYLGAFDYFNRDKTRISDTVKTEVAFTNVIELEEQEAERLLRDANRATEKTTRGHYLKMAGEALMPDLFWSPQRLAYDLESEGTNVYYVETDRHY